VFTFANDIFITICDYYNNEYLIFNALSFFTILEYGFFSFAIYLLLKKYELKKIILGLAPVFIAFAFIHYLRSVDASIDSLPITVENIIIIIFCLFYFFEEINFHIATLFYLTISIWIITGILIYSAGTFFLFLFSENLTDDEWKKWSIINSVFTILKNTCFGIAVTIKHTPDPLLSYESDSENNEIPENNLTINSNP